MGNDTGINPVKEAELRRNAEAQVQKKTAGLHPPRTTEEMQRLVHELEVHQIELEMQNEELNQARNGMERALDTYTDLYDFAPVGYFTLDCHGAIRVVNLTAAVLLGIERSWLIGRRFGQFVAPADRPAFTAFLATVFSRWGRETCEMALLNEGEPPLIVQIEAKVTASGEECRVAVIDISVRRQLEKKQEVLLSEIAAHTLGLETANIELDAFNRTVSHDLKNPLTIINSYCQVILDQYGNNIAEEPGEYIRKIYKSTLRMNRIIDTLLRFSRTSSAELQRTLLDLSAIAQTVAENLKQPEPERRVTFRIDAGVTAIGDEGLLRVVLDNLIGNAWKFTGAQEEAIIEFGEMNINGKTTCFVRDNGPGFDMTYADKLFIPFQRLPGNDVEGTGIGLATVERIIGRHGGRVWADSQPGKGATFFFTLE